MSESAVARLLRHFPRLHDARLGAGGRFVLGFIAIATVLFGLYFFPYAETGRSESWFSAYLAQYARIVGFTLGLFDRGISVADNVIGGRFSMRIVKSCDGMEANILFCAATLAFPGPWRRKLVAVPLGLTALVAFNVLRLCCLYYIGIYFPAAFELAHFDVWPLLVVGFSVVDFLACARWLQRTNPTPSASVGLASP
jgi:exosortase/archaeosortase family protein